ncbi:acyltransferase domain-containing protein [Cohnella zeiphila]|uniref:DUF5596 domain-containing protein n=1 Tax=Cohnella zeiphila TaxID=2761120 RepID=A0A7X0STT4_9BACL|nr:acyltransferase domain-containing protein [Cohnella zeiphila]MBB6735980.1 DUF5596 domain-containing protein [Cohnella zeiphila]
MDLRTFCDRIRLPAEALAAMEPYLSMEEAEYASYKRRFLDDRDSFWESVKGESGYRRLLLYLICRLAVDSYEEYRALGIGDDVYEDTFSDIRIWCLTCARDHGEYGIEEFHWLQEHVQLRLFRLGRLQFQPYAFDRNVAIGGRKVQARQIVLNVHIPEGEPLDPREAEASFDKASVFFRGISPVFVCHSWLLYPGLSAVLSPESNILRFQRLFDVFERDETDRQAEQRIFGRALDDPAAYEERTSLQRNAKAYLVSGRKLGSGYGIRIGY